MTGCDWPVFGLGCEDYSVFGLQITVVEKDSGAPVMDPLVWIKDGSYVDTLDATWGHALGAEERAGKYVVNVEHPSFEPWKRKGVRVEQRDGCHVRGTMVRAELIAR